MDKEWISICFFLLTEFHLASAIDCSDLLVNDPAPVARASYNGNASIVWVMSRKLSDISQILVLHGRQEIYHLIRGNMILEPQQEKHRFYVSDRRLTLIIYGAVKEDAESYFRFTASQSSFECSSDTWLSLYKPTTTPTISMKKITNNNDVELTCNATSQTIPEKHRPQLLYSWRITRNMSDNGNISFANNVSHVLSGEHNEYLMIMDSGNFDVVCVAIEDDSPFNTSSNVFYVEVKDSRIDIYPNDSITTSSPLQDDNSLGYNEWSTQPILRIVYAVLGTLGACLLLGLACCFIRRVTRTRCSRPSSHPDTSPNFNIPDNTNQMRNIDADQSNQASGMYQALTRDTEEEYLNTTGIRYSVMSNNYDEINEELVGEMGVHKAMRNPGTDRGEHSCEKVSRANTEDIEEYLDTQGACSQRRLPSVPEDDTGTKIQISSTSRSEGDYLELID